jgi:crossover junction endodeoxyribonuclease RusA
MRIAVGARRVVGLGSGMNLCDMSGDELNLRVDALTSQTRRFRSLIGEFLRLEFKRERVPGLSYEVCIRIERPGTAVDQDVDSVAKAVLDALTGVVFHDNSPVDRLSVTKHASEHARVSVIARPISQPPVIAPPLAVQKRVLEDA